jgi:drug/metabolite transporter (DMT)-like permease
MLVAVLLFATLDALVKAAAPRFSVVQIVFFRSLFAFLPLMIAIWWTGGPAVLRTRHPLYHAARGTLGLVAMGCFYTALGRMPLADVVAISFSGPLFIALLAGPMLGERVGLGRWLAITVGFAGVLLVLRPGTAVFSATSLLPLLGALAYSSIMVLVRRAGTREHAVATAVFFTLFTTAASATVLPWSWQSPLGLADWSLLIAIGVVGGCGNLCLTQAFRGAPVALLAPLEYTALLWGLLFGYAFWGERPDALMLVGAATIALSGLAVLPRPAFALRPRG